MVLVTPVTNHDCVSEATQPPLRKSALTGPSWEATKPKFKDVKVQWTVYSSKKEGFRFDSRHRVLIAALVAFINPKTCTLDWLETVIDKIGSQWEPQ